MLDCEKDRGKGFSELLSLATFVVTNSKFPHLFTTKEDKLEALLCIQKEHAKNAKVLVSTLGSQGSILIWNEFSGSRGKIIDSFSELQNQISTKQEIQKYEYRGVSVLYCPAFPANVVDTTGLNLLLGI